MNDRDRPLNERGQKAAPKMGKLLLKQELIPDLILSSNALRAYTTASLVAEAAGYQGPIELHPEFYGAPAGVFYQTLAALPETVARVLLVGHNPDLEELAQALSGQFVTMPTAGLAQVELSLRQWNELSAETPGKLLNFWKPHAED